MNWTAVFIAFFFLLVLLEVGVQLFINKGRQKSDGFLKLKIRAYKEKKAQKEKRDSLPM